MDIKEQISKKYLRGNGVEFGALHSPLPINKEEATIIYIDRLKKTAALRLFPELQDVAESIVDPEITLDFNSDDLSSLRADKFDFFIANHLIEHLVNPVRFLEDMSNVLRPGNLLFLTVPDKDYTFDKHRALTTNNHLWDDYCKNEKEISNEHIKDFLLNKEVISKPHPAIVEYFKEHKLPLSYYNGNKLPLNPFKRKRLYDFHRERSIHVHVWNKVSFKKFFTWINVKLQLRFEQLNIHIPEESVGEIIYLLKKVDDQPLSPVCHT